MQQKIPGADAYPRYYSGKSRIGRSTARALVMITLELPTGLAFIDSRNAIASQKGGQEQLAIWISSADLLTHAACLGCQVNVHKGGTTKGG